MPRRIKQRLNLFEDCEGTTRRRGGSPHDEGSRTEVEPLAVVSVEANGATRPPLTDSSSTRAEPPGHRRDREERNDCKRALGSREPVTLAGMLSRRKPGLSLPSHCPEEVRLRVDVSTDRIAVTVPPNDVTTRMRGGAYPGCAAARRSPAQAGASSTITQSTQSPSTGLHPAP